MHLKNQILKTVLLPVILSLLLVSFIKINAAGYSRYGKSFYTKKLQDEKAVYLIPENFPVTPDKKGDDSDALQQAIDKVAKTSVFGIVMIPEGEYEISKTVYVWKGIRLIGYGPKRPVFVLKKNTPGYDGKDSKYMIYFAGSKPGNGQPIRDANPGTFYSALSNINFKIEDGNPGAVAVRSHFAQHSFIAHCDFFIGKGKAGVEKVGNEMEDCRFFGGRHGIIAAKTSPSWPFLLIDSYFEGQDSAAITTEEAGLTIINCDFFNVPGAVSVNPNRAEELFISRSRFENIDGPAVIMSDDYNARAQYNIKNLLCINVPVFASFRESKKQVKVNYKIYRVADFFHGLQIKDLGAVPKIKTSYGIKPLNEIPAVSKGDIPQLPTCREWVNLKSLGAKGDSVTDDTRAIKEAVARYRAIYIPSGRYRVTQTIKLKPNTVLIGLNPITTQIILTGKTPEFCGIGSPKALLETPKGGSNIIIGIGLDAGAYNERAVAAIWKAGKDSYMNDVRFVGGHGTYNMNGTPVPVYNKFRNGNPYTDRKWDSQYWSLWITDGGGGTFKDIWTPNTFAMAGIYISNTSTPGRLYDISVEHHVRNEVILKNVSNWNIYAMQTEEESAESPHALPLLIENSSNITFANLFLYRVIRMISPFPEAVEVNSSVNLQFNGMHIYSPSKFSYDNTVYDRTYNYQIREREIGRLNISDKPPEITKKINYSAVASAGAKVEKLVGGFEFIDGAAIDGKGNVYFIDSRWRKIYRWSPAYGKLDLVRELLFTPSALAFDKSGNLLVTTKRGKVVTFNPQKSGEEIRELKPVSPDSVKGAYIAILPGHRWRDEHDFLPVTTYTKGHPPVTHSSYTAYLTYFSKETFNPLKGVFLSPDGTTFIPQCEDLRRAYSLRKAIPGYPFYMADEFDQKTYKFSVRPDGSLFDPELFAEKGELDAAVDENGNVYIPAGQIFVYNKNGKQIAEIRVPERPANVVFGGNDRKTLYITARSSLYKIDTKYAGRKLIR